MRPAVLGSLRGFGYRTDPAPLPCTTRIPTIDPRTICIITIDVRAIIRIIHGTTTIHKTHPNIFSSTYSRNIRRLTARKWRKWFLASKKCVGRTYISTFYSKRSLNSSPFSNQSPAVVPQSGAKKNPGAAAANSGKHCLPQNGGLSPVMTQHTSWLKHS